MPEESQGSAPETQETQTDSTDIFAEAPAPEPEAESTPAKDTESEGEKPDDESVSSPEEAKQSDARREYGEKAEKRIKSLLKQVGELRRQIAEVQPQKQQDELKEPVLEEYDDMDKWKSDFSKYTAEKSKRETDAKNAEEERKRTAAEQMKAWNKKAAETAKRDAEFDTMAYWEEVRPSTAMDAFFQDSDLGPDVLSHLYHDSDIADKIRDLPPIKAVRELIAIENSISNRIKGIKPAATQGKPKATPSYVSGKAAAAPAKQKSTAELLYG